MNGGGNPSVGGGGFAASPAGTAPLYYKSAEIASGSAKNLCKKSEDVGGVCPARHRLDLPLWKTQWGACPGVAGAEGVSDTRRGACPVGRPPTLPLVYFPAPYPPSPLPRWGRGRFIVFLCKGLRPLHPRDLNPRGTHRACQAGTRRGALPLARRGCGGVPIPCEGAPSASPVRRKTDRTAILLAVPPAKERGDRGRGTSAFEMVLSPGAGEASAARVQPLRAPQRRGSTISGRNFAKSALQS